MSVRIIHGDCRDVLRTLPDQSVHCVVTSPPYWGLRSYLPEDHPQKPLEIGSEPTLAEWVDTMVVVFREVRRVLRDDGTLWLNLGDSYAGSRPSGPPSQKSTLTGNGHRGGGPKIHAVPRQMTASGRRDNHPIPRSDFVIDGLKPKDMMGQPWRVAFALQADGWWLRQEIIWHKPNPMPESARDRCTKAHEHLFLLSKSDRYFYDFEAMQEPVTGGAHARQPSNGVGFGHGTDREARGRDRQTWKTPDGWDTSAGEGGQGTFHKAGREKGRKLAADGSGTKNNASFDDAMAVMPDTRNPRSVWTIPTHGFKGAHFATFPPALAERCITAGCPLGGTVLDPFGGSGTVGLVADRQNKSAILIDLDERNLPMASERITDDAPMFATVQTEAA